MKLSREQLIDEAQATGFRPDVQEKVILLIDLLTRFNDDRYLRSRIALKGGTALNLFVFDLPRLSVDIDLNYIGAVDRETMEKERPLVEKQLVAICEQEGFRIKREPSGDAGGKYVLGYASALGSTQNLQVDLNFMFRVPLFAITRRDSRPVGSFSAKQIPVLDDRELAAGKIAALIGRTASRDLFDTCQFQEILDWTDKSLRLCCVLYGAMAPKDWRNVSTADVKVDLQEVREKLLPVLRDWQKISPQEFTDHLIQRCKTQLSSLFPLTGLELEFIERLRAEGQIVPALLTDDQELQEKITQHPALKWRALKAGEKERKSTRGK